jgi:hypothetical protein
MMKIQVVRQFISNHTTNNVLSVNTSKRTTASHTNSPSVCSTIKRENVFLSGPTQNR